MTKPTKWKKIEHLVYDIQKELAQDAVVTFTLDILNIVQKLLFTSTYAVGKALF